MILIDSNIWIYLLDRDMPENRVVDRRLAAPLRKEKVLFSTLVQTEVLHHISRQLKDDLETAIQAFLTFPGEIHELTQHVVHGGARLLVEHAKQGIGGRDAMLLATAMMAGARLVTHDKALLRAAERAGVPAWDPVKTPRSRT